MDDLQEVVLQLEERLRQVRYAVQTYYENPNNRLSDPHFSVLVDEFFAAQDALLSAGEAGEC
jgi:hypothetical protein